MGVRDSCESLNSVVDKTRAEQPEQSIKTTVFKVIKPQFLLWCIIRVRILPRVRVLNQNGYQFFTRVMLLGALVLI